MTVHSALYQSFSCGAPNPRYGHISKMELDASNLVPDDIGVSSRVNNCACRNVLV